MTRKLLSCLVGCLLVAQAGCATSEDVEPSRSSDADDSVAQVQLGSHSANFQGYFGYGDTLKGSVGSGDPYDYAVLEAGAGDEVFFDASSRYRDDLVLLVYRWTGQGWSQIASNDDCYDGTLNSCITLSSDVAETYAALVTTYSYAYRGVEAFARYELTASCFSCDTTRPGVPEGGDCGGIGALECAEGLVCDYSNNEPGCFPDATGICQVFAPNRFCTREYAPVCGCDGRTYNNECERRGSYVGLLRAGPC